MSTTQPDPPPPGTSAAGASQPVQRSTTTTTAPVSHRPVQDDGAINILLVEDNPDDALLVRRALSSARPQQFAVTHVLLLRDALEHLSAAQSSREGTRTFDAVLLDLLLPDSLGLPTLTRLCALSPALPVVVLSGVDDQELAIEAMQSGAQDYIPKDRLDSDLLARSLRYAIERKRLEEEVRVEAQSTEAERARLAQVLESLPVGVYIAQGSPDAHTMSWTFINSAGQEQLGAPSVTPGVVSETFTVYHADGTLYREEELPIQRSIWFGEKVTRQEMRFRYHSGGERVFEATTGALHALDGEREVVEVMVDVTERKRLEDYSRFQAQLLEQVHTAVIATDLHGIITHWNRFAEELYGWKREEVLGRSITDITVGPADAVQAQEILKQVHATGSWEGEFTVRRRDGSLFPAYVIDTLMLDGWGRPSGMIGASVDITERKRLEEQVRRHAQMIRSEYERLASVIANVDVSIAMLDIAGRFAMVNEAWVRVTGFSPEEILGRRYDEFVEPPFGPQLQSDLAHVLSTGEPLQVREMYIESPKRQGGGYFDRSIVPLRASDGSIMGMLSATVEVTEKVRAREEVEAQRALLETILEATPVGIALYDLDMRLVRFNREWTRMVGVAPDPGVGKHLYDLVPRMAEYAPVHRRVLGGETAGLKNVPYQRPGDQKSRYYDITYRPVRDPSSRITGMLSAVVDVTERHQLDQEKNDFIALTAHELKTPITAIKGYSQMARRSADKLGDERLSRTLVTVDEQTNRLTRLINELQDVSRIQGGALSLNEEEFDLRTLVQEVAGAQEVTSPSFTFMVDLPPQPAVVRGDRQRIEQVLVNLVQNAVKYSGRSTQVDITVSPSDGGVVTSVRDYGIGIPLEEQARIFGRFFRASNAREHLAGLGLGLFIAHGIVAQHGGRMWLESAQGQGSTFFFSLPLAGAGE